MNMRMRVEIFLRPKNLLAVKSKKNLMINLIHISRIVQYNTYKSECTLTIKLISKNF